MKILGVNLKTCIKVLSKNLIFLFLASLVMLPANAALQAVGPINPANGFPLWYRDNNLMPLSLCNANVTTGLADPLCVLPPIENLGPGGAVSFDPALPIVFPTNFPSESFYFIADSTMFVGPNGTGKAVIRFALEGAFSTLIPAGAPAAGNQIAFLRINLKKMSGLVPNSNYTITHPYGTFTVTTDALGNTVRGPAGQAFREEDIGGCLAPGFPCLFDVILPATATNIGPFLQWDPAAPPAAPVGYIGDAVTPHAVIGSPAGNNFFRIDGPDAGGPGINFKQTNLWTVAGKKADVLPPTIVSATANPAVINAGVGTSTLMVTATDDLGISQVTVDLNPVGMLAGTSTLSGAQEVPPNNSTATGSGTFVIDTSSNNLNFNITFSGLTETVSHIHGPALRGQTAPVMFPLPPGIKKVGVWNYPEENETDIILGRTYFNIHSTVFPSGEIRGQIELAGVSHMNLVSGNSTNGVWQLAVSPTLNGTFILPVRVTDGGGNTAVSSITLTVSNLPTIKATPSFVRVGNLTDVTISVTQAGAPVSNATVTLSGAAAGSNLTDAAGNAIFSVNATAPGIITVTVNSITFASPAIITITASATGAGDVNTDGAIDIVDALFIAQHTVGLRTLTAPQIAAADVNLDGRADIVDALFIAQFTVGLRVL